MKLKGLFYLICFSALPVMADTQTEILRDKLDRLEAEMALIQKKVYQNKSVQTAPIISESKTPQNIDEFYATIDSQAQTIQELTQKNEELTHKLSELEKQVNRMNEDVNYRFNELQAGQMNHTATPPAPVSVDPKSEKDSYDNAYNLLKNGEYDKAEQAFIAFMEKYPNGSLIGNANYWLAESYYARKKWAEAAGLFADGFNKYKENAKAPDAMFKLGLTMVQMNKKKEACTAFKGVLKQYKNLSKQLKERTQKEIKELKCP